MPRATLVFPIFALLFLSACSSGPSEDRDTISRETFMAAYIELRVAGLQDPSGEIGLAERDRILGELGLTDEDLLRFVEVRGRDGSYMEGVWREVDSLMRESRKDDDPGEGEEGEGPGRGERG